MKAPTKPTHTIRFSTRGAIGGFFLCLVGYVIVGLNAPWFVTVITVLLSLRWEFKSAGVHHSETGNDV